MKDHLAIALEAGSPSQVCDELCCLLFSIIPDDTPVDGVEEVARVPMLVWQTLGLIGNGGFCELFAGEIPGDPGFAHTRSAYEAIGAKHVSNALRDACDLLPAGVLPCAHEREAFVSSIDLSLF